MDNLRDYFSFDHEPILTIGVNLSIEELQKVENWIISEYHLPRISLNKELSQLLIGKQQTNYSKEIVDWVSQKINEVLEEPILLTDNDSFRINYSTSYFSEH